MLNCFGSSHVLTPVSRQCLKSQTFSLRLSLVSSRPNPKCLGSSHVSIFLSWPMSLSQKKMSWLHHWPGLQYSRTGLTQVTRFKQSSLREEKHRKRSLDRNTPLCTINDICVSNLRWWSIVISISLTESTDGKT